MTKKQYYCLVYYAAAAAAAVVGVVVGVVVDVDVSYLVEESCHFAMMMKMKMRMRIFVKQTVDVVELDCSCLSLAENGSRKWALKRLMKTLN